ncbi:MAG: hypothetical protein ACXVJD_00355 [Mucilaginibacter sp.]
MQFIEIKDFILLPIYLFIIYIIAFQKRNRKYSFRDPLYKYYIPALTVKLFGAVALGMVYQYYYNGGGDTAQYFYNSKLIADYFSTDIRTFIDLVFKPTIATLDLRRQIQWGDVSFAYSESNYFPIRIMAVLQLMTISSYLPCALIISAISFTGVWKAYTAFVHMFPTLHKQFAIAFLFMPSVVFWGSGILKDTITFAALCWLFFASYRLFILRIKVINSVFTMCIAIFVIIMVKPYIALAFLPSLVFWIFFQYRSTIRSSYLRVMILPFMLIIIGSAGYFIANIIGETNKKFQLENIANNAARLNTNLQSKEGAAFSIGVSRNPSVVQMIAIAPLAVITAIFRPFIWEVRSPIMLLSSLEGLYIMYIVALIVIRNGLGGAFKVIAGIPLVTFCLIFGVIFSFAVGFSTSNFGTLVRYEIPAIPFLVAGLFLIIAKGKKQTKTFVLKRRIETI